MFEKTLIKIISRHFETELTEKEITFENIIDTEETWSANFFYCQFEYSIIIDNVSSQVILKDAVNTIVIYESHGGYYLNFLAYKEWIYSYMLYLNRLEGSSGDSFDYYFKGLLDYLESRPLDTREFHTSEASSESDNIIPLGPSIEDKFERQPQ